MSDFDAERQMQRELGTLLGLEQTEARTLAAIIRHCALKGGIPLGGAGAVGMAGAGTVVIPVVGAVPGWLAGFAAGFVGGTLMCTLAQRGVVVQSLKQTLSSVSGRSPSETDALVQLRQTLARVGKASVPSA
ncbi:hypothetical protein [Frigidibacter oleivorans]|uniref:hypothetical protein n=1 Tax=Frigidibacter oleivorans TaxID=2487129 RepID=UPI00197A7CF8|nr:hypothetical protein [Frigidibacter oleivorans]